MVLLACTFIGSGTSALASPSFIGSHTEESLQVELVSQNKDRVVTGTVVDAVEGTPLIGANVMIKGMKTGVITDLNGNYSVKYPILRMYWLFRISDIRRVKFL